MLVDNYPIADSNSCFSIGMSGRCGLQCKIYLEGKCEIPDEMGDRLETFEDIMLHTELYLEK